MHDDAHGSKGTLSQPSISGWVIPRYQLSISILQNERGKVVYTGGVILVLPLQGMLAWTKGDGFNKQWFASMGGVFEEAYLLRCCRYMINMELFSSFLLFVNSLTTACRIPVEECCTVHRGELFSWLGVGIIRVSRRLSLCDFFSCSFAVRGGGSA